MSSVAGLRFIKLFTNIPMPPELTTALPHRPDPQLVELLYELLDAHDDTARLAGAVADDLRWEAHLDYLRALQRVARETLARHEPQPRAVAPSSRAS